MTPTPSKICPTKSKIIILLSLIAFLFFILSFNFVEANMGPPPPIGDISGLIFADNEDIAVESQLLLIEFLEDMTFDISAIYTMKNLRDIPISVESTFMSPIYRDSNLREYTIFQGDTLLEYTSRLIIYQYDWDDDAGEVVLDIVDISSLDELDFWDVAYSLVTFTINFSASETLDISFSYNYQPNHNSRTPNRATLNYILTPARYWANYSNLEIVVNLNGGHITSSNLNFERISAGNYTFASETLPRDNFVLNVSSMPLGFGFIQMGNIFLFFLSIVLYVGLGALMIYLIVKIFITAKHKNRTTANSALGTVGVIFFILSLVYLVVSLNWWLAFGFNMAHLMWWFFSGINFVFAIIAFSGFIATINNERK